jgi:hypothetical protein
VTVAGRNNPTSLLESAQALDDVLAVVPQRGREGLWVVAMFAFSRAWRFISVSARA